MPKSHALVRYTSSRRWTPEQARAALSALDTSGLSPGAFAAREGLDVQRLYWWRRRLESSRQSIARPAFVEVMPKPIGHVEVVLRSGRVLRVAESIEGAALRRFVAALEDDESC